MNNENIGQIAGSRMGADIRDGSGTAATIGPHRSVGNRAVLMRPHGLAGALQTIHRVLVEELGPIDARWLVASAVARLLPRHAFSRVRTGIYRAGGLAVGRHSQFFGPVLIWGSRHAVGHISIGERCRITSPFHVEAMADIQIGNNVTIGHSVVLVTATHDVSHPEDRGGTISPKPIIIHDACWIGARAVILPGVTLGRGCVIAAGAVVTKNVEPNTVVGGVPARALRLLPT